MGVLGVYDRTRASEKHGVWCVAWVNLFWDMVQILLMRSRSFPLHSLMQDTSPVNLYTLFCSTACLKCYCLFCLSLCYSLVKLSLCMPWMQMEECRCSAIGSSLWTQEWDEQWVSHPRCFTQGETVPVPIQQGTGWAF